MPRPASTVSSTPNWVAPASVVAPFEYTYIIWAVLFGYLFWSEIPEPTTILGVALLIASSAYIFHWELRRQAARPTVGTPLRNNYARTSLPCRTRIARRWMRS